MSLINRLLLLLYHSHIHEYTKYTWDVHIYIYIEYRNLEIRKIRNNFSVQVGNVLLPLSLKVLRHKEREMHILFILAFSSAPPHLVRHLPKASASKRKSTLLVRCPVLNSTNFLQNSQNPPCASGA